MVFVFQKETIGDLLIVGAQLSQAGLYVCTAQTVVDSASASAKLVVRGKMQYRRRDRNRSGQKKHQTINRRPSEASIYHRITNITHRHTTTTQEMKCNVQKDTMITLNLTDEQTSCLLEK